MRNLIQLYRDPAVVVDPPAGVVPPVTPPVTPPETLPVTPPVTPPVDTTPKSVSATVDINKVTPPASGALTIPDAFKDKPYLKGIDTPEKLFAMLDGAQTMLGKKGPTVPAADAPQAEKDAYYEALGRPKTAAEYKIPGIEKADPAFAPRLQAAMHKHGLTQEQAAGVWTDVSTELQGWMKEKNLVEAQQDIDFTKLATDTFGAERDGVLARGKELLGQLASPAMKPALAKLDNNALIVMADLLRNVDKKYIKQDGPGGKPILTGQTPDELRNKARELMAKQAKFDSMSTEFSTYQSEIDAIYEQLKKAGQLK